jgi:protein gp37
MSAITSIEWTDRTWNPTRGCLMAKGSELKGCLNCYAAALASRNLPGMRSPTTGKPYARRTKNGPRWTGDVELIPDALDAPLRWRKPQRVFVNSMSDLFHEALPDDAIDRVFAVMAQAERHTFQILTKRPQRMASYFSDARARAAQIAYAMGGDFPSAVPRTQPYFDRVNVALAALERGLPLPNVWLGVSVEDQATADERIPLLLQTPAAVRFVSYEPALGPVDFAFHLGIAPNHDDLRGLLNWIIYGGESGPGARENEIAWARSARDQCRSAGVAFFMKQEGARPIDRRWTENNISFSEGPRLKSRKGGDPAEWPADLRVREFPA